MKWLALLSSIPPVLLSHMLAKRKIQEIHVLVNARLTDALAKITQLENIITHLKS